MAQTANEILKQILGVCVQISKQIDSSEQKDKSNKKSKTTSSDGSITGSLFTNSLKKNKSLKDAAAGVKGITSALSDFSKLKLQPKKISNTGIALKGLFETFIYIGEHSSTINKTVNMLDSITKNLDGLQKFANSMSMFLLSIGGSILMIAGSIWAAGKILQTSSPGDTILVIGGILLGMAALMGVLALASKHIDKGIATTKGMGVAMLYLSGGLVAFALGLQATAYIMTGGAGIAALGLAVLTMTGIIGGMSMIFWGLGKFQTDIMKGTATAAGIAIGMGVLSLGVLSVALTSRMLTGLGMETNEDGSNKYDQKTGFGRMMAAIGPGLGAFGIIVAGGVGLMVGLGLLMGTGVLPLGMLGAVMLGGSLALLSMSILSLVKNTQKIQSYLGEGETVHSVVASMVGGVLGGLIEGVSTALNPSGAGGIKGFSSGVKNTAILMNGIGLLMGVSVALSMFAYAMTAFANLGNMRVIESYDEKTGEPKFGKSVDIRGVGQTVSLTISDFLIGLIGATSTLTKTQAKSIKKMGRALTGRRGILSAVISFADVLKTFAEFGPKGEIGFVDLVETGKDEDGHPIYKKKQSKVKIKDVVNNITTSFSAFATEMAGKADQFGLSGVQGKKMLNLAEALMGSDSLKVFGLSFGRKKPGLLEPIKGFAETLSTYSKFGKDLSMPVFDHEGNVVDKVPVKTVAQNVVKTLTAFTDAIGAEVVSSDTERAEDNLEQFEDIIDRVSKIGEAMDPLSRLTNNVGLLADNMDKLVLSLNNLNVDKLGDVAEIANKSIAISKGQENSSLGSLADKINNESVTNNTYNSNQIINNNQSTSDNKSKNVDTNWEAVAQLIGQHVAEGFKSGMFQFEFASDSAGVLTFK